MGRLKTFGKYLLMFVAFYVFSTVVAAYAIKTTYSKIDGTIEENEVIEVKVDDAKSTMVNGYIKGTITNKTQEKIDGKYVKFELYSSKNNNIVTEFVKIDELQAGESKNFTINFRGENIKTYKEKVEDSYQEEKNESHLINLEDAENQEIKNISIILAAGILIKYIIL